MDLKANLTEEMIEAIKEDIQRGLSPKKICIKYHISPVQYAEIRDSMKQKEQSGNDPDRIISPKTYYFRPYVRPYVSPYIRRTRNRHWGLILFTLFVILLIYSIYLVYFGMSYLLPTLVILVFIILIVVLASFINED